ncbi:unnamed protein product [Gongylonema pulchrum]|uniref:Uncharacterized protein n=1 Tax=Gongylonema pulchrum TaxID=637853 RepID=A0A183CU87_9BILA|nr:unnamed protein product [Gongylonema pulchrum]
MTFMDCMRLLTLWHVAQQTTAFYHIAPERPISLSMEACSHERRPLSDGAMIFFPETVRFCGSFYTNKQRSDYDKDVRRCANLQSTVLISWHETESQNTCELEYKGYQQEYRISPDLGYYIGCQKAISQYISQLAVREVSPTNISNENCPLRKLPTTYEGYVACDFARGKWYEMFFKSAIRYEIHHRKVYRTFWSNYSSTFLIRPNFLIKTNATETEWLSKLISLRVRPISLLIRYRIRQSTHVHYVNLVSNRTVEGWMMDTFVLVPSQAIHELCYQMSWEPYEHHLEHCIPFQIDEKCLQRSNEAHSLTHNKIQLTTAAAAATALAFLSLTASH